MRRLLGIGARACIVGVCLTAAAAGCSSDSKSAKKDVTITACTASPTGGHPEAAGKIVNHSSKSSLYTVHVKFEDSSGNAVGDGLAAVAKVDPDATAKWTSTGSLDAKGPVSCAISSVSRTAVP
jgi:hypothetical protein